MRSRAAVMAAFIALVALVVPQMGGGAGAAGNLSLSRVHGAFQPTRDHKIFVALLGHDARPGEARSRGDAIHIVGINTKTMKGGILNFPRDSWVGIPGFGSQRINSALYFGGPDLMVRTLESLTGIEIDYWAMAGFEGFQRAVSTIGGVKMNVPTDVYDVGASGARLKAGVQRLRGYQALAYMRARKPFVGGDTVRTTNQGRFLLAALRKLNKETGENPARLFRWMAAVRNHLTTDLQPDEMFYLGVLASQVKATDVGNHTVPTSGGNVGGASILYIHPGAQTTYARFKREGSL